MKKIKLLTILLILFCKVSFAQSKTKTKIRTIVKENCGNTKTKNKMITVDSSQKNVLGQPLALASIDPTTGYFRNGYCQTDANDRGLHVVAAIVTDAFLKYSLSQGNDLISAYPANNFSGLKAGDVWCLCVLRWKEALDAGVAPPVVLEATNIKALQYVTIEQLKSAK